ncbi:ABC transporter permease [Convivina intestini]|uniref:ABC-2 family transporter n=1 Tax=Convivina intestini TaxID=1505726 RepID=A0A2U1DF50_9LACO|nr:ABC transporter permease [Convivina intestini]PVY86298.1 ABC-2 family transporter [Convivina intestini]CAH1850977.1 hypothetical protein R077811_00200 [Convivina intestini]SDB82281.1 multidrug/hemolysin transport system permease protein [Leuconostocaceae bacterium R-53105]
MLAMINRNLLLYFRDRSGVILSLMGALISFILYIIFLKNNMVDGWSKIKDVKQMLDMWLIGGTLSITGITTTFAGLTQMVKDREQQVYQDILLTDISPIKIQLSYISSSTFIGIIMQGLMLLIMVVYFTLTDTFNFPWQKSFSMAGLIMLSSLLASLMNAILVNFIHNQANLSKVSTLIGTSAGFLVGSYIPIGLLPDFAQTMMKLTPGTYVASLYRQVLMNDTLTEIFSNNINQQNNFSAYMGVQIQWSKLLTFNQTLAVVVMITLMSLLMLTGLTMKFSLKINKRVAR